jgi:hypothetical protein
MFQPVPFSGAPEQQQNSEPHVKSSLFPVTPAKSNLNPRPLEFGNKSVSMSKGATKDVIDVSSIDIDFMDRNSSNLENVVKPPSNFCSERKVFVLLKKNPE